MQNRPNDELNINNFWRINWYSNHISRIYKLNMITIITNYKKLINLEQARKKRFEVQKFYSFSLPWKQIFWYFPGIEQAYIRRKWVKGRPYNWKRLKIGEKYFLFHDKNFLFLRYLYFYLDVLVMWKKPAW